MILNDVETRDNRYKPYQKIHYKFLNADRGQSWSAKSYIRGHNISLDGEHYFKEENTIYFGSYFFLSDIRIEHSRQLFNIV